MEDEGPILTPRQKAALRQADINTARRIRDARIQYDPRRRGETFCRIMVDQVLHDYRVITRDEADKDIDPSRKTSTHQIARDCLSLHGLRTDGTNAAVVERALRMDNVNSFQRSYSTDSFPGIMDSIGSKAMSLGFDRAPEVWRYIVRETTARDFRPFTRVTAPEYPTPRKTVENGEIARPTLGTDSKETSAVESYPFLISLSRQAVINDDLNALTTTAEAAGRAASRLVGDLVFGVLVDNSAMADGEALFSVAHANIGTGGAPSVTTLEEIRSLMSAQTGPSGEVLNIRPAIAIGPTSLESTLTTIRNASSNLLPDPLTPGYNSGYISVVSDARLSGTAWYCVADPRLHSGLEVVTLEGAERPLLERKTVFVSDAIEWKVLHDCVALAVDHRTLAMNAGA